MGRGISFFPLWSFPLPGQSPKPCAPARVIPWSCPLFRSQAEHFGWEGCAWSKAEPGC